MASEFIPGLEAETNAQGEIACDLDEVKTISFTAISSGVTPNRNEISDFNDQGFLLYNLMLPEECNMIIAEGEKMGFERMKGVKDEYRSAQRLVYTTHIITSVLIRHSSTIFRFFVYYR